MCFQVTSLASGRNAPSSISTASCSISNLSQRSRAFDNRQSCIALFVFAWQVHPQKHLFSNLIKGPCLYQAASRRAYLFITMSHVYRFLQKCHPFVRGEHFMQVQPYTASPPPPPISTPQAIPPPYCVSCNPLPSGQARHTRDKTLSSPSAFHTHYISVPPPASPASVPQPRTADRICQIVGLSSRSPNTSLLSFVSRPPGQISTYRSCNSPALIASKPLRPLRQKSARRGWQPEQ